MPRLRIRSPWPAAIAAVVGMSLSAAADQAAGKGAEAVPGARDWERCAICHGVDGAGRADGTFPKIAGQYASVIEAQLVAIREGDRPNPVMKPHVDRLADPRDVADISKFVAGMPRSATCDPGPGDDLARGEQIYSEACLSCHGAGAEGSASDRVPWLACQHYDYLVRRVRQLAAWGRNTHPATNPALERLTDAELRAVMDYAMRLPILAPPASKNGGAARADAVRLPDTEGRD